VLRCNQSREEVKNLERQTGLNSLKTNDKKNVERKAEGKREVSKKACSKRHYNY
jgi:hypothetical protein